MTKIAFIRHAPTAWNRGGRLQGRTDVPLDEESHAEIAEWSLPTGMMQWRWVSSPLLRARDTAQGLSRREPEIDARLTETDWGDWEGSPLADIRRDYGDGVARDGKAGLDFAAPNGESPRQVQQRLKGFLLETGREQQDTVVVSHKGVIRAVYALATGWDMMQKPETKLRNLLHIFSVSKTGDVSVDRLNVPLDGAYDG